MNIEPSKWAYAASEEIAPSYNEFDVLAAAYTIDNLAIEPAIAQLRADLARATADNSSLAERLTAAELERDRLGAELEELQGSHDLNQIASDALNDLRADLARVTAERDQLQSIAEKRYEEFRREANAHYVAAGEIEKLETRVAELEKEAMILRGTVEAVTTQRQQAEQRNAELVAALDDLLGCPTVTDRATCPDGDPSRINEAPEWQAVLQISCAWTRYKKLKVLARAESATPAKQEAAR